MRYGVVADLHGNRRATLAVTAALHAQGIREILCAGDLVGYNAWPALCVDAMRAAGARMVYGNHDLIATGRLDMSRCAPKPAHALNRTRRILDGETGRFLGSLPATQIIDDHILLTHAALDDVSEYIVSSGAVARGCDLVRTRFPGVRVCVFGHSHVPGVYRITGERVEKIELKGRVKLDLSSSMYFINPGSVDAARRVEHQRAEYAILDSGAATVEHFTVAYDHEQEEDEAIDGGFRMNAIQRFNSSLWRRVRAALSARRP